MSDPAERAIDEQLLAAQRAHRKRLGLFADGSRPRSQPTEFSTAVTAKIADIAGRSPPLRQQQIDLSAPSDMLRKLKQSRSALLLQMVNELVLLPDSGLCASLDELALTFGCSRIGMRKAIDLAKKQRFIEVTVTGPSSPRRIRLNPTLRLAFCEGNHSITPLGAVGDTAGSPYKPLTTAPKSAQGNDSSNGTPGASRARHDSDGICNPIMQIRSRSRISKRVARALLDDAAVRADVLRGLELLKREGIDEREAQYLACCHAFDAIHAAYMRCRQEQERANAGKRPSIGKWQGFLHRAITNSITRPELKSLLAQASAARS